MSRAADVRSTVALLTAIAVSYAVGAWAFGHICAWFRLTTVGAENLAMYLSLPMLVLIYALWTLLDRLLCAGALALSRWLLDASQ